MTKKPSLLDYLNIHHFLNDLYKYRKINESDFSYEIWAQELDIKNRSFLRQVVTGRRGLTLELAKQISARMNLQGVETQYFDLLVQYSRARTVQMQNALAKQMMKVLKVENCQEDIQNYKEFVSNTLYPKLQTLLTFKDIKKTPEELAYYLGYSATEITEALETLSRIKLVETDKNSEWQSIPASFKVPENLGDLNLMEYHAKTLKEAIAARNLPKTQRRFLSLILPMNEEELPLFWDEFNKFKKEMILKFNRDDLHQRRLFQMNINIYSVSDEGK